MNWLLWIGFALKVALNLLKHGSKFQKEVPEAVVACRVALQEIMQSLDGGLTEAEVERIARKLRKAVKQIEDVFELLAEIVPIPK